MLRDPLGNGSISKLSAVGDHPIIQVNLDNLVILSHYLHTPAVIEHNWISNILRTKHFCDLANGLQEPLPYQEVG